MGRFLKVLAFQLQRTFSVWINLLSLCFHSVQVVTTLLVLIRTDNFTVNFYWRSLTDEQILAMLHDLWGDDSGNKRTVRVLDVKKVACDLSGSFAKVGAPGADSYSSNSPDFFFYKNVFPNIFLWFILYTCRKLFKQYFVIVSMYKPNKKHV